MITSFFNKSNPIQGIFLSGLLMGLVLYQFWEQWQPIYFLHIGILWIILFQHHLLARLFPFAHQNAYVEAFATVFFIWNAEGLSSTTTLAAYLFVLLALRQFLALPTAERPLNNTFIGGLSLGIAVLIYAPSLWAIALFFVSLILFEIRSLRLWLLAAIALFTPLFFYSSIAFLWDQPAVFFDTRIWNQMATTSDALPASNILLFAIVFLAGARYFFSGLAQNNTEKSIRLIVALSCFVFGLIDFFYSSQENNALLFFAFPFSIVLTFTTTTFSKSWHKNLFFYGIWVLAFSQWIFF